VGKLREFTMGGVAHLEEDLGIGAEGMELYSVFGIVVAFMVVVLKKQFNKKYFL